VRRPFSMRSDSSAFVRRATYGSCSGSVITRQLF
jgi:hypothetical protein